MNKMEEDYRIRPDYDENKFASHGTGVGFEWFAYLNSYDESVHHITPELEKENSRGKQRGGFQKQFFQAINSNSQFRKRVKFPFVVATGQFAPGGYPLDCLVDALRSFFRTDDILMKISSDTPVSEVYKGKDLILPLVHADAEALDFMEFKAEQYLKMGCRSVTALFVYRIKPGIKHNYPAINDYPYFSQYDFAGSIEMDSGLDLLSALANGLAAAKKSNVYIGGL